MRINLASVPVGDQAKALKFFTEVLGFVKKTHIREIAWLTVASPEVPDQEYERTTALGAVFRKPPTTMGPVTIAVLEDTCGNLIQIVQQS